MTTGFRVTESTIASLTLKNLQGNLSRMQQIQEQLSSGRRVNRASDSPTDAAAAMQYRATIRGAEQFSRNTDDGLAWLGVADNTITGMLPQVNRARDLLLQGMNAATSPDARNALADEVHEIRDSLLGQANTTYLGRYIFAGTANTTAPGQPAKPAPAYLPDGTWNGNQTDVVRTMGPGVDVAVNASGTEVFGDPATGTDLFAVLQNMEAHLRTGDTSGMSGDLDALQARFQGMQGALVTVGARYSRVQSLKDGLDQQQIDVKNSLSEVEDIDLPKTLVDLQLQQTAYQAALAAGARVIQPSLMDFLR